MNNAFTFTKRVILVLIIGVSFHTYQFAAPAYYDIDWQVTPFHPENTGSFHWETYATGHKNMYFSYHDFYFQSGYPQKSTTFHGTTADRLVLISSVQESEFWMEFHDFQLQNADYVDGLQFNIHDIDDLNEVQIEGIDNNGNIIYPTILLLGGNTFTYNQSTEWINGNGLSSNNMDGSIKVRFDKKVHAVTVRLFDFGGSNSDHRIVLDNIHVDMDDPYANVPLPSSSLDWDVVNYTSGSINEAFPASVSSPVNIKVNVLGSTSTLNNGYPQDNAVFPAFDLGGSVESLVSRSVQPNNSDIYYEILFDQKVDNVIFSMADIDNFIDNAVPNIDAMSEDVSIEGFNGSQVNYPFIRSEKGGSSYHYDGKGSVTTSTEQIDWLQGGDFDRGTLHVYFPQTIDRILIKVTNIQTQGSPGVNEIGISSIHYTYNAPPQPIIVEGYVFNDVNNNKLWDSGEKPMEYVPVTIYMDKDKDMIPDYEVASVKTSDGSIDVDDDGVIDPWGMYRFVLEDVENYLIIVKQPDGYIPTADPDNVPDNMTSVYLTQQQNIVKPFGYILEKEIPKERKIANTRSTDPDFKTVSINNPVSDLLYISLSPDDMIQSLTIYDMSGRRIYSQKYVTDYIDMSQFLAGQYILGLHHSDGRISTHRVCKL